MTALWICAAALLPTVAGLLFIAACLIRDRRRPGDRQLLALIHHEREVRR